MDYFFVLYIFVVLLVYCQIVMENFIFLLLYICVIIIFLLYIYIYKYILTYCHIIMIINSKLVIGYDILKNISTKNWPSHTFV